MYPTKNVTFRCYELHADIIGRAAEKVGKSLSDYCRDIVIPWAASDLGERLPHLPKLEQGRHQNLIAKAAKLVGLTPEQFERKAAEQAAARALDMVGPEDAQAGSGEYEVPRADSRPGSYSRELLPPERLRRQGGKR